jgi:ribosome hibernation promoting factor
MQLEMQVRNAGAASSLRTYVERRLAFALDRFEQRIRRVSIRLSDLNGPRGGVDKVCRIQAQVSPAGTLTVEERSADIYRAVDGAAHRLQKSVRRTLRRRRGSQRRVSARRMQNPTLGPEEVRGIPPGGTDMAL